MRKIISAISLIAIAVMLFTVSVSANIISPTASTIHIKDPYMMENHHYPTDHVIFTPEGNKGIFTYIGEDNIEYWIHNLDELSLVENVDFTITQKDDKLIIEFLTQKAEQIFESGDYIIDAITDKLPDTSTTTSPIQPSSSDQSNTSKKTDPVSPDTGSSSAAPISGLVALAGAGAVVLLLSKRK